MISLLLVVFILQVVIYLINTIGANTVNELAWLIYSKLPTSTAHAAQQNAKLKGEVVRLKKEMNGVSAQDNFSKWAKLRRQHDKALSDFEKSDSSIRAFKTKFDTAVKTFRWVSTSGLRFFLQFWYSKQPLFWIPQGWLPYYVEWLLSFPRAPLGSISIQIWGMACVSIVTMSGEALKAIYVLATEQAADQKNTSKGRPQAVPMQTSRPGPKGEKEL
ncbi:hypothetical protein EJ05DRAFT_498909 [Pseudovirgaria hyperparasitica]|uniref:Uncharacterized protein n=1 Tax=Pseudovirgaria hyperparasitica TaxID=470096 RepID=A0A6A6WAW5_9PEZI|nr:uncharacterized protein EJ05DRAFT_498909 [Pseudovirgaria hyperparasitica]KAF2759705.1 hypothetical protein EJ05DRAFT_498909 [Pseudovirgaria hyperparasitica]